MTKNNAKLYDPTLIIQAGLDRRGLPQKYEVNDTLNVSIKKTLRILDEQDAIRRYIWYNLPSGLTSELIERILYYKGQGAFFYMPTDNNFYFLPYALNGNIDVYGRFRGITPVPFNGTTKDEKNKAWIEGLTRTPIYALEQIDETTFDNGCVILYDYCKQRSETIIPRQQLQEPLLNMMSEALPLARTNMIANSGVKGWRVQDEDQADNVDIASRAIFKKALAGEPYIPIIGAVDFQELSNQSALKSEEYLIYLQALDNYRLSLYGLKNGGLFQKKSHMLESEQEMNEGNVLLAYQDGLTIRQNFCDIVNIIWGLGISCEASECVLGYDANGDGLTNDEDPMQQVTSQESGGVNESN